jgi:uncharacterized protein YndB with AHSA1/START domain
MSPTAVQVRRTFAAPRAQVFQAWIDPQIMSKWFARGPGMPPVKVVEADARVGGRYRVDTVCPPDNKVNQMTGTYRELDPPARLVFTWWWEGADFETSQVTVEFKELGPASTEVILTHELLPEHQREEHRKGWIGCFDLLEKALES